MVPALLRVHEAEVEVVGFRGPERCLEGGQAGMIPFSTAAEYLQKGARFAGEKVQGLPFIGSPELAAYEAGFISKEQLQKIAEPLIKSEYGKILSRIAQ